MSTRANNLTRLIILITAADQYCCHAYQPNGRWGQRTTVARSGLFVYGGKSDQYNEFSYTSAPNINDLLFLPLNSSFGSNSPPWQILNGSLPQSGPVAWHTISSINDSSLLLFGGQPDYRSASLDHADSAYILNLPTLEWVSLTQTWVNEPIRRIRHSSASIPLGSIVMVGGEKADGSGNALLDNYTFDPNKPSFVQLSNAAGPSGIYDHASVVLSDGRLLVLGGYNQLQGSLVSFSSVWLLDTQPNNPNWSLVPTSNASLPDPRRAFAAASLYDDNILIHGGSDASLQQNFADGWMLNTSSNPMTWTKVEMLTQLGPRRDHFAVAVASGHLVLFGFGYGDSAPASPTLYIYDVAQNNFVTTYTPTPSGSLTISYTQTYSRLTSSTHIRHSESASDGSSTAVSSGKVPNSNDKSAHVRSLALVATFICLAVAVAIIAALFYARRYRQQHDGSGHFFSLGDDDESKHSHPIPAVVMIDQELITEQRSTFAFLNSVRLPGSLSALGRNAEQPIARRRDMLAEEDAYDEGQSYLLRREHNADRSSWSFKSFVSSYLRNREASTTDLSAATHGHEKSGPYAHDEAMSLELEREQMSVPGQDSISTHLPYRDPFMDPVDIHEDKTPTPAHPLGTLSYYDPLWRNFPTTLGPLSEQASQLSLPLNDSSGSSTEHKDMLSHDKITTGTDTTLTYPPATSLINANPGPTTPISRTDSWWKRFTRNSFVDRKLSITSRSPSMDFKERSALLESIEERMNPLALKSVSKGLVEYGSNQVKSRSASASDIYEGSHGRSLSSLRTAGTDAIEKIGGVMDVIQRVRTRSHSSSSSMTRDRLNQSSNGSDDIDELFTSQG
ncbi:hypothetical protein APHAL10511_004508 [Amanita phalloides]|nr:hypothetical protein APHAL10511_004508 [Amanita phalloides]